MADPLATDTTLQRELAALRSVIEGSDSRPRGRFAKFAGLLLSPPDPAVEAAYRTLADANGDVSDDAYAFDPSAHPFDWIENSLRADIRKLEDLLASYGVQPDDSVPVSAAKSDAGTRGSRIDEFIDSILRRPMNPRTVDARPLRLYYLSLRIQALQRIRRDKCSVQVDTLVSSSDETLGIALRRYREELAHMSSAAVVTRSVNGISGSLPISDPFPEERRFCAEMISRLEARAITLGKRQLVDVATVEQLHDRLERMRLARQVEREMSPAPPAAPKRSDERRLIDDLLRLARTVKQYDEEAQTILKKYGREFPELEKEIERKRRELLDRLRDSH